MSSPNPREELERRLSRERSAGMIPPDDDLLKRTLDAVHHARRADTKTRVEQRPHDHRSARSLRLVFAAASVSAAAAALVVAVHSGSTLFGTASSGPSSPQPSAAAAISASLQILPASGHDLAQAATAPIRRTSESLLATREWSWGLETPVSARP